MTIHDQISHMQAMGLGELRDLYAEVFGEATTSRHKQYLIKRIAWRLQANNQGGLSDRAVARARELAEVAELRLTAPIPAVVGGVPQGAPTTPHGGDQRLVREYKGQSIVVTVEPNGFRWKGELYGSLSAVAKAVTGSHWNGKHFFRIGKEAQS